MKDYELVFWRSQVPYTGYGGLELEGNSKGQVNAEFITKNDGKLLDWKGSWRRSFIHKFIIKKNSQMIMNVQSLKRIKVVRKYLPMGSGSMESILMSYSNLSYVQPSQFKDYITQVRGSGLVDQLRSKGLVDAM
ncbi:hypothetical protein PPACK8108_LOCUS23883 [Phakopsora pachyrhizi]|uniref:Uncharacterized protein n=1 Tax=Phakopsora pachyrhizi TaxID=170000 RepID=A0AAV0BQB3_PHAPC|nr:hypothetical protein PPACK8108_LOCUS23883 [Phakopsora pachyrhizi]